MKLLLLSLFIGLASVNLNAQYDFNKQAPIANLLTFNDEVSGVDYAITTVGDLNGDGNEDLITAGGVVWDASLIIYLGDGTGNILLHEILIDNIGSIRGIALGDVDGDLDLDLYVARFDGVSNNPVLFLNDGAANYTPMMSTSFQGIMGNAVFFDKDNDGDQDLLCTGTTDSYDPKTVFYENDGTGIFTEVPIDLPDLEQSIIAVGDVTNNGALDLFVAGDTDYGLFSALLKNPGNGQFLVDSTQFGYMWRGGGADIGDIDNDGDLDLILFGAHYLFSNLHSIVYLNDGSGQFVEDMSNDLRPVFDGDVKCRDVNNDGYLDLFLLGHDNGGDPELDLYINDGTGHFVEDLTQQFDAFKTGRLVVSDFDNDNLPEMMVTGGYFDWAFSHYHNEGSGQFEEVYFSTVRGSRGESEIVDVNGDGYLDIITAGNDRSGGSGYVYLGDGTGDFTELALCGLVPFASGSMTVGDVDGDNDPDILLAGLYIEPYEYYDTKLFLNDGSGFYEEDTLFNCELTITPYVHFIDVDNDGDLDFAYNGFGGAGSEGFRIYFNDGTGGFSPGTLYSGTRGLVKSGDVDNDGDEDIILGNYDGVNSNEVIRLNDGAGNFSNGVGGNFTQLYGGVNDLADVDGDNDLDMIVSGKPTAYTYMSELYLNDGNGSFTLSMDFDSLVGKWRFTDIDNDGDQDLFFCGDYGGRVAASRLYVNNGLGDFNEVPFESVDDCFCSSVQFIDVNNDARIDLFMTGPNFRNRYVSDLYINDILVGIEEVELTSVVYPNPFTDQFSILMEGTGEIYVQVSDLNGRIIFEEKFSNETSVATQSWERGIYVVNIMRNGRTENHRLVKM